MDEGRFIHRVFQNDPIELISFINKYAKITTKYSIELCGFIKCIDPVSESIILEINNEKESCLKILMGHSIKDFCIIDPPSGCEQRARSNVQEANSKHIACRKKRVLEWLSSNLLSVEDIEEVLQLHGGMLSIVPPYTHEDCISSNTIVLGKIQDLLLNMPEETNLS